MKEGRSELRADVAPEIMSEEEKDGEVYIRHPPAYRSNSLNRFISKLDHRLDADIDNKNKHPRTDRRLGSPRNIPIPARCKKWMVKKEVWHRDSGEAREETRDGVEDEDANVSDGDISSDLV